MSTITCQLFRSLLFYILLTPVQLYLVVGLTILNDERTHENNPPQTALQSEPNRSNAMQVYFQSNDISSMQPSCYEPTPKVSRQDTFCQTNDPILHNKHQLLDNSSIGPDLNLKLLTFHSNVLISASLQNAQLSHELTKRSTTNDSFSVTKPEDHPYAVLLFFFDRSAYLGCCSGSLVSLDWVVTAASHCIVNNEVNVTHVEVYAGGNSEKEWLEKTYHPGYQLRNTTEFFVHPNYSRKEFYVSYYDVALVKVEKFVKSSTVSDVEIHGRTWNFDGYENCTFTGFGKHQFYEERDDDYVRKTFNLMAKSPCPCLNTSKAPYRNWICSKPMKNFGICGSDWGAALVCNNTLRALAVVVISYKDLTTCNKNYYDQYLCTQDNSLSIFQNIFPCIKWMNRYLKKFIKKPIHMSTPNKARKQQSKVFSSSYLFFTVYLLKYLFT